MGLLFSEPTGSGVTVPGAVLIQGDAIAEDGIVADMKANPDLATLIETVFARQPTGAFMSTWIDRRLFPFYYVRILIYVTPRRAFFWPTSDFTSTPRELDIKELNRVD